MKMNRHLGCAFQFIPLINFIRFSGRKPILTNQKFVYTNDLFVVRNNSIFKSKVISKVKSVSVPRLIHSDSELEDHDEYPTFVKKCTNNTQVMKHVLYPDLNDPVIISLVNCESIQAVFNIVNEHKNNYNSQQLCQTVLTLFDLQNIYYSVHVGGFMGLDWNESHKQIVESLGNYISERNSLPTFYLLLDLIKSNYKQMDSVTLAYVLLFLSKLGLCMNKNNVLKDIKLLLQQRLEEEEPSLKVLSLFSVSLKPYKEIWAYTSLLKIISKAMLKIDNLNDIEEFHQFSIILRSGSFILNEEDFQRYKKLVEDYLKSGKLDDAPPNTIIKVLGSLNFTPWMEESNLLIRDILLLILGKENELKLNQVVYVYKLALTLMEPQSVISSFKTLCSNCFKTLEEENRKIPPSLLSCFISQMPVVRQHVFNVYLKNYMFEQMPFQVVPSYSLLPQLKICSKDTINKFWTNISNYIFTNKTNNITNLYLDTCERYMAYTNSVNNSLRCFEFEKSMMPPVIALLKNESSTINTKSFIRFSTFFLSYGLRGRSAEIPGYIFDNLMGLIDQYKPSDYMYLSRALRLAIDSKKTVFSSKFYEQYANLSIALNRKSIEYLMNQEAVKLIDLNLIVRGFISRKGTKDDYLFSIIQDKYKHVKYEELNSRILRNTVYNLMATTCFIPELMDLIVQYTCKNHTYMTADTMGKLLHVFYVFGYMPPGIDKMTKYVAEAMVKDFDSLNGLGILQAALSLAYFQSLPTKLVKHIFSVQFLEILDKEIQNCYSKDSYPMRVRYHLMQLNRTVCIDYMEVDVPWFHEKYCQNNVSSTFSNLSSTSNDVYLCLKDLVEDEDMIHSNAVTHYGYIIDYLVCFDNKWKPVTGKDNCNSDSLNRVAIILHGDNEILGGEGQFSIGALELKKRHLEILGYKVVVIPSSFWNAMYMTEINAKKKFLINSIGIN